MNHELFHVLQVTTAGKHDKDMEVGFYTDIWFDLPTCPGPDINPGFSLKKMK